MLITLMIGGVKIPGICHPTIGDGSCLIHSVLHSVSKEYRDSSNSMRREMARVFRSRMSSRLRTSYSEIAGGELKALGLVEPTYSYNHIIKVFASSSPLGDESFLLVSDLSGVDLIFVDLKTKGQIARTSTGKDSCVVVICTPGHYSAFSMSDPHTDELHTTFSSKSPALSLRF